MDRMITALFDNRNHAEQARADLTRCGLSEGRIDILTKDQLQGRPGTPEEVKKVSGAYDDGDERGFWGSVKDFFMPDEDRSIYEEAVRRGGFLMTARVDEAKADEAIDVLEKHDVVDIEKRGQQFRQQGWTGDMSRRDAKEGAALAVPLAEERLAVGKRSVEGDSLRVRTYVSEQPVREEVRLREENVDVERRPVNQRMDNPAGAFQEREFEMTERREEPVVSKHAVVTEEVVLKKTADDRTETVTDTLRKTEVDVDRTKGEDRSFTRTAEHDPKLGTQGSARPNPAQPGLNR